MAEVTDYAFANSGQVHSTDRLLEGLFSTSEIVIGLVGAVGADLTRVSDILSKRLAVFRYKPQSIKVSKTVIPVLTSINEERAKHSEFERISEYMDAGNTARERSGNNAVLALGVTSAISSKRDTESGDGSPRHMERAAYIIDSLKHPSEVAHLKAIYGRGFYLIGVHCDTERRKANLVGERRMSESDADSLIKRDEDEQSNHGQKTRDTFFLADFFVRLDGNDDRLKNHLWRILDLLFASPELTPTFDEYAMFMAFAASLRSADLSRQVGAVVTQGEEILATGANDCPRAGGGLYWPAVCPDTGKIYDEKNGRDVTVGVDANKEQQQKLVQLILDQLSVDVFDEEKASTTLQGVFGDLPEPERANMVAKVIKSLRDSGATYHREAIEKGLLRGALSDITEYGRVVHAEMDAILPCARRNVSTKDTTLFCTTFPCHNCAKHIVAAGIKRVVFVEPYAKSKALDLHRDALCLGFEKDEKDSRVLFEPFVGVGPGRFFDMFSMRLSSGSKLRRKDRAGRKIEWAPETADLRVPMFPYSYLELELYAGNITSSLGVRDQEGST